MDIAAVGRAFSCFFPVAVAICMQQSMIAPAIKIFLGFIIGHLSIRVYANHPVFLPFGVSGVYKSVVVCFIRTAVSFQEAFVI